RNGGAPTPSARAATKPALIDVPDAVPSEEIAKRYETVTTLAALDAWIARIEAAALTALDIETDSLDPIRARLIGLSLSVAPGEASRAAEYSCEDSDMALHVHQSLAPRLDAEPGLADVYRRIEMPTSRVLGRIERTGVLIDSALLAAQGQELAERMAAL